MDKIQLINNEIKLKIKPVAQNKISIVNLSYNDIVLNLYIQNINGDVHIKIDMFFRRGYYLDEDEREMAYLYGNPSDKGDGALVLALTVKYCNQLYNNLNLYWILVAPTDWWYLKGVCMIKDACKRSNKSNSSYEIDNNKFLEWSEQVIVNKYSNIINKEVINYINNENLQNLIGDGTSNIFNKNIVHNDDISYLYNMNTNTPEIKTTSSSIRKKSKSNSKKRRSKKRAHKKIKSKKRKSKKRKLPKKSKKNKYFKYINIL
jgi:hypothetical protein